VAGAHDVVIDVAACGVCRTDLHVRDGDLTDTAYPVTLGHEIVGRVAECGASANRFAPGTRVGVAWLGFTCGRCRFCASGRENLCAEARFTGYHRPGGFAEATLADERFVFELPDSYSDVEAAPLLCAGLIGYRALRMTGDALRLGLYGFGAAAHIVCQVARFERRRVFAFVRPGDAEGERFATRLGAEWAGASTTRPPDALDAAIIFAPIGSLVPAALAAVDRGGIVVCAGIHMSEIPAFPYELLWGERTVRSVANLTRRDGEEFLALAPRVPVRTEACAMPLQAAEDALARLREGRIQGAAVLVP